VFACAAVAAAAAFAQPMRPLAEPPAEPQPRVAYDMHSARINQIRATPDSTRLVTVGQDKTVRVWRMVDLVLMRTIHVPSAPGEEGSVRALAVLPDGREVIVGGWTGRAWRNGEAQLYRFDLASGRLLQTIRGFPDDIIEALALSPDGRRLAVGLNQGGLRIIDPGTGAQLFVDANYRKRVAFADFAPDGTLATTSADGCLRLYDRTNRLFLRSEYEVPSSSSGACSGTYEMGGVRFSPDGRRVAFGSLNRAQIVVYSLADKQVEVVKPPPDPQQRSLFSPNWTPDGLSLYMHGDYVGPGPTPLYRKKWGASGPPETLRLGSQLFTNVLPLADGDLIFSTTTPSLARYKSRDQSLRERLPPNGRFDFDNWQAFRLSRDAMRLALPMRSDGTDVRFFSLGGVASDPDVAYRTPVAGDSATLRPPQRGGGMQVQVELRKLGQAQSVIVNGRTFDLLAEQRVHSWATLAQRGVAVFGTQWSVLMLAADGRKLWENDLPAPAFQVTISEDGRWVVAAVGDGSLHWYAVDGGAEALGLFLHNNGKDWVAWLPDGRYASSYTGDNYFGWLVNRGDQVEPDFFRAVQFERDLYKPQEVAAALDPGGSHGTQAPQPLGKTIAQLSAPRVRIESISESTREVRFWIDPAGTPVSEVGVFVDGLPIVTAQQRRALAAGPAGPGAIRSVIVPEFLALDSVRVEATAARALGQDETVPLYPVTATPGARGRLRVLVVGVGTPSELPGSKLPAAVGDAEEFATTIRQKTDGRFASVEVHELHDRADDQPTKANILGAISELALSARPDDTTLVFSTSHGVAAEGDHYLMPGDAKPRDNDRLACAADAKNCREPKDSEHDRARVEIRRSGAPSFVSATELTDALRPMAGRRILILDACFSGASGIGSNPNTLIKRSASAQVAVMSSATGAQEGLFLKPGLPEEFREPGMRAGNRAYSVFADALAGTLWTTPRQQELSLDQWFDETKKATQDRIARLSKKVGTKYEQTPVMTAIPILRETVIIGR
jgi:Tol biopolymer transport system component